MTCWAVAGFALVMIVCLAVFLTMWTISDRLTRRAIREMEERLSRPNPLDGARIWGGS